MVVGSSTIEAPSRKLYVSRKKVFEGISYVPHSGQQRILNSKARFKVTAAGRRFGKSENGGHRLTTAAFLAYYRQAELQDSGKRMEYWIVGPNYSDAEKEFRVLFNDCTKLGFPYDRPASSFRSRRVPSFSRWRARWRKRGRAMYRALRSSRSRFG